MPCVLEFTVQCPSKKNSLPSMLHEFASPIPNYGAWDSIMYGFGLHCAMFDKQRNYHIEKIPIPNI
jgi:hypothetical protein